VQQKLHFVLSVTLLFGILEVRPHLYVRQQVSDAGNCALINMQIISPFLDRIVLLTT